MSLRPLWIAGRFLTRLPFPDPGAPQPGEAGAAVPWYPFVGLLIGASIALGAAALAGQRPLVDASLLLVLWVWSSGALHLDGLADTADAWIGGIASRERTLEIMKDPRSGPAAVTAIGLVLIAKWSALQVLVEAHALWPLLCVPMLARAQLPLLLLTTPYARERGMAADPARELPRRRAVVAILSAVVVAIAACGWIGVMLSGAGLVAFLLTRRSMMRRISGFTGDTAGALVELTETLLLLAAALSVGRL